MRARKEAVQRISSVIGDEYSIFDDNGGRGETLELNLERSKELIVLIAFVFNDR